MILTYRTEVRGCSQFNLALELDPYFLHLYVLSTVLLHWQRSLALVVKRFRIIKNGQNSLDARLVERAEHNNDIREENEPERFRL